MTKFFISPGDPSGIGPEITLKALSKNKDIQNKFVLAGDKTLYLNLIDRNNIDLNLIDKAQKKKVLFLNIFLFKIRFLSVNRI